MTAGESSTSTNGFRTTMVSNHAKYRGGRGGVRPTSGSPVKRALGGNGLADGIRRDNGATEKLEFELQQ